MKTKLSLLLILLCLTSCAQKKTAPQAEPVQTPNGTSFSTPGVIQTDSPRGLPAEQRPVEEQPYMLRGEGADSAGLALGSGILIGAQMLMAPDAEIDDLKGTCLYGHPDSLASTSPCVQVSVRLLDENQKTVASTNTNQAGRFRFYIPKGQSYFIQVTDRKGRKSQLANKVGRANIVSLYLKP